MGIDELKAEIEELTIINQHQAEALQALVRVVNILLANRARGVTVNVPVDGVSLVGVTPCAM